MKKKSIQFVMLLSLLAWCCVSFISCSLFTTESNVYRESRPLVAEQNYDSAYMKLKESLLINPHSAYAASAQFGIAEYYLMQTDYTDALISFQNYIKDYPQDSGVIIAELILYKLSSQTAKKDTSSQAQRDFINTIRKKVFATPHFFAFAQNKKRFSYRSTLGITYTIIDYVDKVVVLRDGETYLELTP